ncbi:MAG: DNA mismatch repair endonuclease MutL, partial [Candidatus Dormibacteria bacterium]
GGNSPAGALDPGRIRRLPPEVAELIAAGEVIERPASVLKELIENSLDAGAHSLTIEIEGGGVELIRVTDDGWGMTQGELAAAFERHATSKLASAEELAAIATLGFRGEALASIAAVAEVVAISRERGATRAHEVKVGPGGMRGPTVTAGPVGTTITVRHLFHTLPARRAFLRSPRSEAAACLRVVADAALGWPRVRCQLRSQGRTVLNTPGTGHLLDALAAVFGEGARGAAVEVDAPGEQVSVSGALCAPSHTLSTRQGTVVFVNGRRVQQRSLLAAVEAAYRGMMEVDRHPIAVLQLSCDPLAVDVNVHPTKREVRLRDEGVVFDSLQRACWQALHRARPAPLDLGGPHPAVGRDRRSGPAGPSEDLWEDGPLPSGDGPADRMALEGAGSWRPLGQAHNRYLVLETPTGLAILDQHAAHEKVLYERYLEDLAEGRPGVDSQGLLEPLLVQLPSGCDFDPEIEAELARAGFEVGLFGERTLRCTAAPVGMSASRAHDALLDVMTTREAGQSQGELHRMAALLACHSAVRFGDPLSPEETRALLAALSRTKGGITCPHGRPAVLVMEEGLLLAAFHRQ